MIVKMMRQGEFTLCEKMPFDKKDEKHYLLVVEDLAGYYYWIVMTENEKRRLSCVDIHGVTEGMIYGKLHRFGKCDKDVCNYAVRVRDGEESKTVLIKDYDYTRFIKKGKRYYTSLNAE